MAVEGDPSTVEQRGDDHRRGGGLKHDRHGSVISTRPLPIDLERPTPWNRWLRKAIHYWRYGYSHPDEDLLGVIDAIGDTLNVHIASARAILDGPEAEEAARIREELDQELAKKIPDFSTLLGIEARVNALYPPHLAERRRWILRDRFERVASPGALRALRLEEVSQQLTQNLATRNSSPDPSREPERASEEGGTAAAKAQPPAAAGGDPQPPAPVRQKNDPSAQAALTEAQVLLGYIHSNYLLTIAREKAVRDVKRWLLMRFWFFLVLAFLTLTLSGVIMLLLNAQRYWGLLLGLFLVAIVGRLGATMSIIRRMQSAVSGNVLARDPLIELTALRTGKNEISLALISSSIFALLLYAFFLSGVPAMVGFQHGIFPEPLESAPAASSEAPAAAESSADRAGRTAGTGGAESMALAKSSNAAVAAKPPEDGPKVSGVLQGRKLDVRCEPGVDCDPFDDLAHRLGLSDGADFFKLLLWAFLAGFAERFVPDVLDRVVSRGRQRSTGETQAILTSQAGARGPVVGAPATRNVVQERAAGAG